jgi:hypothetical protein
MRDTGVGRICLLPFFFRNASEPLHDNESMLERNEILFSSLVPPCRGESFPNAAIDVTATLHRECIRPERSSGLGVHGLKYRTRSHVPNVRERKIARNDNNPSVRSSLLPRSLFKRLILPILELNVQEFYFDERPTSITTYLVPRLNHKVVARKARVYCERPITC